MAWSTRQVSELAGTSLRAVRHHHEIGLLDEPDRGPNGYKQYGVAHLRKGFPRRSIRTCRRQTGPS